MHGLGAPVQIAYVVPDVFEAAARWVREFGTGPFFVNEHIELADVVYRGAPARFDHSSAYGQWGPIMVELLHDHGTVPSVVSDRFGPGDTGLHHLAFIVDDLDHTVRRMLADGYELAMSARTSSGTAFHFVDTHASLGHLVELYEPGDRLTSFYDRVAAAADGWDGAEPIRFV